MNGGNDGVERPEEDEEMGELVIIVGCSEAAIAVFAPGQEVARIIPRSELSPEAIKFE